MKVDGRINPSLQKSELAPRHMFKIYLLLIEFVSVACLERLSEFAVRLQALCCVELVLCSLAASETAKSYSS